MAGIHFVVHPLGRDQVSFSPREQCAHKFKCAFVADMTFGSGRSSCSAVLLFRLSMFTSVV